MKFTRSTSAFTLVEIMIVVAIIGLLAAISIPNYVKSRETTFRKTCMSNLKQLEGAVQSWALETRKSSGVPIASDELFGSTNYLRKVLTCPLGGNPYLYGMVGDPRHVRCVLSASPDNHTLY
jgi:prepilin-type N-terminal cleavage/methylation domain-containing protein